MDPFIALQLIESGMIAALGAALLWFPAKFRHSAQERHAARLREFEAGAEEAYFEERRDLEAYRPARKVVTWQLLGALLVIIGAFQAFVLFTE